ncbi:MAG: BACON domain-containing protein [Bacteroidales bacterium]|nr:BACON domain-containing protein [Bacteroidales bacterium]
MKKIFKIFFAAALLSGVVSCTDLLDESLRGRGAVNRHESEISAFPEGARLTLGFNVPMPVATKAMTELPKIDSIHVLVFSNNGLSPNGAFLEMKKAELGGAVDKNAIQDLVNHTITNASENTVIARWSVDLMMGRGIRHLHFVANLPEDFEIPEQGTDEFTVMRSLRTTGGDVAYWQMVVVEDGLLAYTYNGSQTYEYVDEHGVIVTRNIDQIDGFVPGSYNPVTQSYQYKRMDGSSHEEVTYDVGKGDYITKEGLKVLDGGGYYASLELSQAVNLIPLVRNFARIKVLTTSSSNFRLKKAVLINTPESGYVAPFDDAASQFVDAYRNAGNAQFSHATILATGYPATMPLNHVVTVKPSESALTDAAHNAAHTRDSALLYMYERGIPTEKATSLLVYGTLAGVDEVNGRWFKIEISDKNGEYFPVYRDFTYEVEIKSISGSNGYETMDEAYDNDPIGDISNSNETRTLTKIDDGNGLTLWVEYIDKTSADPAAHSVRMLYKFYKGSDNYSADHVTLRIDPVTGREPAINSTEETLTGYAYSGTDTPDEAGGWYVVDVPLYGNSSVTKVSTLHVEGKLNAKTLYRNVTYRVMPRQHFTLENGGLDEDAFGVPTSVTITLPDYLGYSMFPLTLMIEAENGNLNPAPGENLSVASGTSLFSTGSDTHNAFYFLKTLEYDDYLLSHSVTCYFKTTKESGNATRIAVTDREGYFNTDFTQLNVQPSFKLSTKKISIKASQTTATFEVRSNTEGTWHLSATNGATLSPSSGTGNATITVTLPGTNPSEIDAREFLVTATLEGFADQTLTVTQAPLQLVTVTETATFSSSNFRTGNNVSAQVGDISVNFSRINNVNNNRITITQNTSSTVTFTPVASADHPVVTITAITISFRQGTINTYNPSSISGPFSGGTGNSLTATYNGQETTDSVDTTLTTQNNRECQITGIEVTYSYQYYE